MESAVHHNSTESDTISDTNLSPVQAQVIAALAQGRTTTDAARDAGIHRTTVHHWRRTEPNFNTSLQEAQREYVETLQDGMRDLAARAVETLRNLLDDPNTPPAVRLRTALAVLQRPHFPQPGWHLPERIESPREQQVVAMQSHNPSVSAGAPVSAPIAPNVPCSPNHDHSPSVSAGASSAALIAPSTPCPPNHDRSPSVSAGAPVSTPIARCAPCPCGSGNKYKRCCGSASAGKFTLPAGPQRAAA
jgi:hypothetical protein